MYVKVRKALEWIGENPRYILCIACLGFALLFCWFFSEDGKTKESSELPDTGNHITLEHSVIKQEILCEYRTLEAFYLKIDDNDTSEQAEFTVRLFNEEDSLIQSWNLSSEDVSADGFTRFLLDSRLKDVKGKKFTIEIDNTEQPGSILVSAVNADGTIFKNSEKYENTSLNYKLLFYSIGEKTIRAIVMTWVSIIGMVLIFVVNKKSWPLHRIFMAAYIVIGLGYLIALPLAMAPDETSHYIRAYEISKGKLIAEAGADGTTNATVTYPKRLSSSSLSQYDVWEVWMDELQKDSVYNDYSYNNTALYAPVSYLPQTVGILAATVFTDNTIIIFYLGRLAQFICIGLILFFSIKYIPSGKIFIFLIAFLPMNMQEEVSLAPDGMVTAISCAMVALVLYLREKCRQLTGRHLFLLYLLAILISLYKIVYLPICLIYFLIPSEKFKSRKSYWIHVILIGSLVLISSLGWLKMTSRYLIEFNEGVDSAKQLAYILHHIPGYFAIIAKTVVFSLSDWFFNIMGSSMGWFNVSIDVGILLLYTLTAFYITGKAQYFNYKNKKTEKWMKLNFLIVILAEFLLICTSEYIGWTPVEKEIIDGIQGRYFIPLLLLLFLVLQPFYNSKESALEEKHEQAIGDSKNIAAIYLFLSVNLCVVCQLFNHYILF